MVIVKDYIIAKRLVYLRTQCKSKNLRPNRSPKNSVNDEKLKNNLTRARGKILEYALCNPWNWFFTATLDPQKYDRTNLKKFQKDFTRFLKKFGRDNGLSIKYLIVPELHADGKSWHAHGFISGLPEDRLTVFSYSKRLPQYIRKKLSYGYKIYEFKPYTEKFGFNDFEPIIDLRRSAHYICKYVSKSLGRSVSELGMHTYFASKGLNTAKEIDRGTLKPDSNITFDYESDYFGVKWLDENEDYRQYLRTPDDDWILTDYNPFED